MAAEGGFGKAWRRFLGDPTAEGDAPAARTRGAELRKTVCCFCSCGCGIQAAVRGEKLLMLEGDPANPINEGTLCSKGAAAGGLHRHPDRLRVPRVRRAGAAEFQDASWEEALDAVADRLFAARDRGWEGTAGRADGLAFLGGAVNTNEEAYLYKKLGVLMGLAGIEHQARI